MFKKQQLTYYTGNYDEYVQQVTLTIRSLTDWELCTLLFPRDPSVHIAGA